MVCKVQQFRIQISQAYITLDRPCTIASRFSHKIRCISLPLHPLAAQCLHLHAVCPGFFRGKDIFPLDIGVYHNDHRLIICQFPDNRRHFRKAGQFAGPFSSVPRNDLIIPLRFVLPHDCRNEDAILPDTFNCFLHLFIVRHTEGVAFKGMKAG